MHVIILLSGSKNIQEKRELPRSVITKFETQLRCRASFLNPGYVCEFGPLEILPSEAEWAQMSTELPGVDLVSLPAEGRRKAVLLADMDSTMIEQECIDELAAEIGCGAHVANITAAAMNGEIAFEEALRERVALLKDLPVETIAKVIETRITLAQGGKTLLATMRAHGAYTALVSGGFTDFTARIAAALGFDAHRANKLARNEDGTRLSGRVTPPILGADEKVKALDEITFERGASPREAIAVGDGANDLPMLLRAGMGVALHAKPSVAARAPIALNHGDLSSLLYLQGYHHEEFITPSAD